MTLYMIGLGLWDEKDISVKGLEAVRRCDKLFFEAYTSKLGVSVDKLEGFYGKRIIVADRSMVETQTNKILSPAKNSNVAFLVVGDVFSATTHVDLYLRAKKEGVDVIVINNASILNSIGVVGLELYKYGRTTSIPFHNKHVITPYDVVKQNKAQKLHTLLLLDIDAEHNSYMTIREAIEYLLGIEDKRKESVFTRATRCVGVARLGSENPEIIYGTADELLQLDFGEPLHTLIIPSELHFIEEEALNQWRADKRKIRGES